MARACMRYQTGAVMWLMIGPDFRIMSIERIYSRVQQLWKFILTKESVHLRKALISHRIGLVQQHVRLFIILKHQYSCRDVMYIRSMTKCNCVRDACLCAMPGQNRRGIRC